MDLWQWCDEFERRACAAGDAERQQLFRYFHQSRPLWETNPEQAEGLLVDGRQHATRLAEPWWQLIYEHWRISLLNQVYRSDRALDAAVRAIVEARKPRYAGCPIRAYLYLNLVDAYTNIDPFLYESRIREAQDAIQGLGDLDRECLLWLDFSRLRLELLTDRLDAVEEAGLRLLASSEDWPFYAGGAYAGLCSLAFLRADWDWLQALAAAGEEGARRAGSHHHLTGFLLWQAVTVRRAGKERAAQRLYGQASAKAKRLGRLSAFMSSPASGAYHEVGGDFEGALSAVEQAVAHYALMVPAWKECHLRLRRCQLLAHMGHPLDAALAETREVAQRMGNPAHILAKLDRIESEVAAGEGGPTWSWQRGNCYHVRRSDAILAPKEPAT